MKDKKLKQRKFYDKRYFYFQRALHKLSSLPFLFYDKRLIEIVLESSNNENVDTILEVGSGQGTDAILVSRNTKYVVGIDISVKALKIAKFLSQMKKDRKNISFIVGDAEHLPFKEDIFDIVYCKDLLHHVSDSMVAVSEMKRVTKEGRSIIAIEANACNPQMIIIGLIYFSVDKGVFKNTKTKLATIFSKVGLSNVKVIEAEFLPRHILFEYRSPINRVFDVNSSVFLRIVKRIEYYLQKRTILSKFCNYLIIEGVKKNKKSSFL